MYVQMGSENGGIVLNLGLDGVAFQAAIKLTAESNSALNLRIRGSGLNVELPGELAWLGPTQKEVGIRFKSLSSNVRQEIEDWIAREARVSETPAPVDRPRPRPMPAMPGLPAAGENSLPHSLSAALAMSRAMPVDLPSSAVADATGSSLRTPLASGTEILGTPAPPEIVSPIQQSNVPTDELDNHPQGSSADLSASPEPSPVEQPLYNHLIFERPPIQQPDQSPAVNSSQIVLSEKPMQLLREALQRASVDPPVESAPCKTEKIETVPQDQVSLSPGSSLVTSAAERWIPPALLDAWRKGNRQHKFLLVATPVACLLITALILTLAVTYFQNSLGPPAGRGSLRQPTARLAASGVSAASLDAGPLDEIPELEATDEPQPDQPPPSSLERFAQTFLGYKPDKPDPEAEMWIQIKIDKDHVGVPVWASKSSGYYYCTDSPYYKSVQPGAFMTQRDALQSGYQPKLRRFCN
jgi:hypothetical protein